MIINALELKPIFILLAKCCDGKMPMEPNR
jgi:hypothetical protein